jgi:hypothetical protein
MPTMNNNEIALSYYIFLVELKFLVEYEIPVVREEIVVRHTTVCCSSDHSCTISSFKVGFSCLIVPPITEKRNVVDHEMRSTF